MSRSIQLALIFAAPLALLLSVLAANRVHAEGGDHRQYVVRIDLPPVNGMVGLPEIQGPPDASRPLVVLDPGHGGHDPGASNGTLQEKSVTLALALAIRDELLTNGGVRVAMTREQDRYLMLAERSSIARRLGADLFVSIHADSAENDSARGASVYVLSERGSSEAAARFAARENQADTINGVAVADTSDVVGAILLDLSQREAQAGSEEMAGLILREAQGDVPVRRNAVQSAAFAVLKAPDIPSVLFETGYMSNPEDAAFLASEEGRTAVARSTARAIRVFLARQAPS